MKDKVEIEIHITCANILCQGQYPDYASVRQELGNKFDDDVIAEYHKSWVTNMEELSQIWASCSIPKNLYPLLSNLWESAEETSERNHESEIRNLKDKVWETQEASFSCLKEIRNLKKELADIKDRQA